MDYFGHLFVDYFSRRYFDVLLWMVLLRMLQLLLLPRRQEQEREGTRKEGSDEIDVRLLVMPVENISN